MKKFVFWILLIAIMFFPSCKTLEPVADAPLPLTIPESFSVDIHSIETIETGGLRFESDELKT